MAHIWSNVDKIDNLWLEALPRSRVIKIEKAIAVERIVLFVTAEGRLYHNGLENYSYMPGIRVWTKALMRALLKLKIITKQQMDDHLSLCNKVDAKRIKKNDLDHIQNIAKRNKIKLTKAQLKRLS